MLTAEQKEIRRQGLGATDAAVIMGLSPYKTPYELWLEKTNRKDEEAILPDCRLRLRHAHEETIAREYATQKEVKLKRINQTIYHKNLSFMLCHIDRVVIGQKKIVECKSSSGFMRPAWGESGSDEVPLHYIVQVQHQLACWNGAEADIAALIDIDDYRIYPIPRNEKIISKIESACDRFWHDHVLADIAPAPTNRADLKLMYPVNNGNFIQGTDEAYKLIDLINALKFDIKNLDDDKAKAEKSLLEIIADNDGLTNLEGKVIATFQANKNGTRSLRIK